MFTEKAITKKLECFTTKYKTVKKISKEEAEKIINEDVPIKNIKCWSEIVDRVHNGLLNKCNCNVYVHSTNLKPLGDGTKFILWIVYYEDIDLMDADYFYIEL